MPEWSDWWKVLLVVAIGAAPILALAANAVAEWLREETR
jgi:hypothetical protein